MIVIRTENMPGCRIGYLCMGKITLDEQGNGVIQIKGKNYSQTITGVTLTYKADTELSRPLRVDSIQYFPELRITSITVKGAEDREVFYSFWIDVDPLPNNQSVITF